MLPKAAVFCLWPLLIFRTDLMFSFFLGKKFQHHSDKREKSTPRPGNKSQVSFHQTLFLPSHHPKFRLYLYLGIHTLRLCYVNRKYGFNTGLVTLCVILSKRAAIERNTGK
jgi:hypothetical protein